MYTKVFRTIYDGTLADNWQALVTFQQLLILANDDGVVDMTVGSISRTTGIPLDILHAGIATLEAPDAGSRTPDMEGRRIVRMDSHRDWGWFLVNFKKYRSILSREEKKESDRNRISAKRAENKTNEFNSVASCRAVSPSVADVAHTDLDLDLKSNNSSNELLYAPASGSQPPEIRQVKPAKQRCPTAQIVALYHEVLPELPSVEKITASRAGYIRQRWLEDLNTLDAWRNYFTFVRASRFLMGLAEGRDGKPPFRADLEWLTKAANFAKVAEEKYHR